MVVFPVELRWLVRPGIRLSLLTKLGLIFGIAAVLIFGEMVWGWDILLDPDPQLRIFILARGSVLRWSLLSGHWSMFQSLAPARPHRFQEDCLTQSGAHRNGARRKYLA